MYRVDRNNFYKDQKKATIYTPSGVSEFIYKLVSDKINKGKPVLDPCVGRGALLEPFKQNGFEVIGIDIEDQGYPQTIVKNYLEVKTDEIPPPFASHYEPSL